MDPKLGSIYVGFLMQIGSHLGVTFELKMIQMRFGRDPVIMRAFIGYGGAFSALKWEYRGSLREQTRRFL
jgi:hypothetical protein